LHYRLSWRAARDPDNEPDKEKEPLAGKGDFFHDGRFATLSDVVDH
jgi:hypothetical protein